MIRLLGRGLAAALVIIVTMIAGAAPAAAHNSLRSTTPSTGQRLATAPTSVVLEFDEPAIALGTQLVVTGPDGEVQDGSPELVDTEVHQKLRTGLGDGAYTVAWRVTSADGHPISGTFDFVVGSGSAAPTPSAAPTEAPGSGVPWIGVVAVTVGIASIGVAAASLGTGRRRR